MSDSKKHKTEQQLWTTVWNPILWSMRHSESSSPSQACLSLSTVSVHTSHPLVSNNSKKRAPLELGNRENKAAFLQWNYCAGSSCLVFFKAWVREIGLSFCDSLAYWWPNLRKECHWKNEPAMFEVKHNCCRFMVTAVPAHGWISGWCEQ